MPKPSNIFTQLSLAGIWILLILPATSQLIGQNLEKIGDQTPFKITGSVGFSTVFFNAEGRRSNRKPFTWLLRGDPTLNIYGIAIPVQIIVSEQERDFRQPFNRFGLSPAYKWAKLHLGYQNLNFSKYALAGHAMAGAGFELQPGKLRLGYMYGRLLKAVQPNRLVEDSEFYALPSFQRAGHALKIGYGTPENFFDLVLLKAQDDINSIDSIPTSYGLQPAANTVLTMISHQRISEGIKFEMEYAQSSYTNDVRSEMGTARGVFKTFSFLADPKVSTEVSTALDAALDLSYKWAGAKVRFERISPNYRSMGAYFFLNDVQKITIEPRLKLFNNRLHFYTSLGFQKNNLNEQKSLQTNRTIGSIRITARPISAYNININYSNYGVSQKEGLIPLDNQNLISQVTKNWGIIQNLQISNQSYMHSGMLSYQRQQLKDKNPVTAEFTNYQNNSLLLNYNLNYLPAKLGFNINYTHSAFEINNLTTIYRGPSLSLHGTFVQNKLRLQLGQSFLVNQTEKQVQRKINKTTIRATYKLSKIQKLTFRAYFNQGKSMTERFNPFNETKIDLQYVYRFQ